MKKLILILVVLAMAAPAVAGTVNFAATDNGNGTCTITYYVTGGVVAPVALGVTVEVTAGNPIKAVTDMDEFFEIFMDDAYDMELDPCDSYVYGAGDPVADPCGPGGKDLPASKFVISMGGLGGPTKPPTKFPKMGTKKDPVVVAVLHSDTQPPLGGTTSGIITVDALRGGVIDEDGEVMDPNGAGAPENVLQLPFTISECFLSDHINQAPESPEVGNPDYDVWVSVGKPACWCYQYQCRGDTDGEFEGRGDNKKYVVLADAQVINAAWLKTIGGVEPEGPYWEDNKDEWICADFDHDSVGRGDNEKRVTLADAQIINGGWLNIIGHLHFTGTPCFP